MKKILISYIRSDGNVVSILMEQEKNYYKAINELEWSIDNDQTNVTELCQENFGNIAEFITILSSNYFITRELSFPFKNIDNIKQAIYLEMGPELPIKENNLIYDFIFLDKSKNKSNVLGIGGQKSFIEGIFNKFSTKNSNTISTFTLDIQCIISSLNSIELNSAVCLYEDGDYLTLILKDKDTFKYHKFYSNLKNITNTNKKIEIIENFIRDYIGLKQEEINLIVIPSSYIDDELISRFNSIKKYKVIEPATLIEKDIKLTGNIDFSSSSHIICLLSLYIKKHKDKIIDFDKKGYVTLKEILLNKTFLYYLVPIIMVFIFISTYLGTKIYFINKFDQEIRKKIQLIFKRNFPEINRELTIEQILSVFRGKINELQNTEKTTYKGMDPLLVLRDISLYKPDNINLIIEEFSFNVNKVILKGKTDSLDTLTSFRKNINKHANYKVSLKQANWDKNKKSVHFIVEIEK